MNEKMIYLICGIVFSGLITISAYFVIPASILLIAGVKYKEPERLDIQKYESDLKSITSEISSIKSKMNLGQLFGK